MKFPNLYIPDSFSQRYDTSPLPLDSIGLYYVFTIATKVDVLSFDVVGYQYIDSIIVHCFLAAILFTILWFGPLHL